MTTAVEVAPCRLVKLAYERAERDAADGFDRGLWFDQRAADHVIDFFENRLQHYKGEWAGKPFILEAWQVFILSQVFGWKNGDGTRRYRTVWVEIPRKNGKSTMAAGVGLYLTFADNEPGAEVYSTATTRDQAKIVWTDALRMVEASPDLRRYAATFKTSINVYRSASLFQPLSSEAGSLEGKNTHGNIVDEIHVHKNRDVWDTMDTSSGSRRQPLTWAITTAGVYAPESIGYDLHNHAQQVLEQSIEDDSFFAFIAAAETDEDWADPEVWIKANPNYGVSVKPDYIANQCRKAKSSPQFLNAFWRRHLNIWTSQIIRWLDMDQWNACNAEALPEDLAGAECYGGLDLASTVDLAAFIATFPDDTGAVDVIGRYYIPGENVRARVRRDRVPYDLWIRQGWITPTPGNVIDYAWIRKDVNEFAEKYDLREVGYDRWNASQLAVQLTQDGVKMVPLGMGFATLNDPTKALEALVRSGKLAHGGDPVLRWAAANVATEEDAAGNLKPSKRRSAEKIDPIVALILSLDRLQRHEPRKVYPSGGLQTI